MVIDFKHLTRDYIQNPLKFGELPNKEDFEYLYLELNMTLKEVSEFFRVFDCGSKMWKWMQ